MINQTLRKTKEYLKPYYKKLDRAYYAYGRPLIWLSHRQRIGSLIHQDIFTDVRTYCMFLGQARSGHSIIASLLDAHRHIVLSDELDALKYIGAGFDREQLFHLILKKSRMQAHQGRKKSGRRGKYYSYEVPGQWQGKYEHIGIIGDKKGGASLNRLASNPGLLEQLRKTVGLKVKLIVVMRNPYDSISTQFMRNKSGRALEETTDRYFDSCRNIDEIRRQVNSPDILFVRHEDFVAEPVRLLSEICRFLDTDASAEYLNDCASTVYRSPVKSRHEIHWPPALIDKVKKQTDQFDFLEEYAWSGK